MTSSTTAAANLFSSPPVLAGVVFILVVLLQIAFTSSSRNTISEETKRRLQHMTTGQALVLVSYLLPIHYCLGLLGMGCLLIVYVRFFHDAWYRTKFHSLLRPYELQYGVLPGAFYFLLGCWSVAAVFSLEIARYSVLCLTYADPMAAWVGSHVYSNVKITKSASLFGCLACFLTALIVGLLTLPTSNVRVAIVGAVACTIAEALPYTNDNVMIPIATAAAIQWSMSFE